jgi:hypothetical protein
MVKVRMTDRGLEVVRNLKDAVQRCHKEQFGAFPPEKLSQLRALLKELGREERAGPPRNESSEHMPRRQAGAGS